MFDNWWMIQQMMEAREREIRARIQRVKPWMREQEERKDRGGARKALGSLLISWGTALTRRA